MVSKHVSIVNSWQLGKKKEKRKGTGFLTLFGWTSGKKRVNTHSQGKQFQLNLQKSSRIPLAAPSHYQPQNVNTENRITRQAVLWVSDSGP